MKLLTVAYRTLRVDDGRYIRPERTSADFQFARRTSGEEDAFVSDRRTGSQSTWLADAANRALCPSNCRSDTPPFSLDVFGSVRASAA